MAEVYAQNDQTNLEVNVNRYPKLKDIKEQQQEGNLIDQTQQDIEERKSSDDVEGEEQFDSKQQFTESEIINEESYFDAKQQFFSIKIAKKHAKSNRVFKEGVKQLFDAQNGIQKEDICPCCSSIIQSRENQIPLLSDPIKDLSHLGPTYPLYFQFMRYSIFFVFIILAIPGIYSLVENSKGNHCYKSSRAIKGIKYRQSRCKVSFITQLATSNRSIHTPDSTLSILNLVACICLILFSIYYRIRQQQVLKAIDKSDISVQDFSIFVNKIPRDKKRKDIKQFFESKVPGVKIEKIVQAFQLKKFNQLSKQLSSKSISLKEKKDVKQQMEQYEHKCSEEIDISDTFTGAAFISFEKEEQAIQVIKHFARPFWKITLGILEKDEEKLFAGSTLFIRKAPEPGDTNWNNMEIPTSTKILRRIFTLLITSCLLAGSFCAIFLISKQQQNWNQTSHTKMTIQVLGFCSSLVIIGINQLLQFLIQIFAEYDGYNFKTDKFISVAKTSGIAQFVNTTMVQFVVKLIQNGLNLSTAGGLVYDITLLMIFNSILPALISLLQIDLVIKFLKQKYFLYSSKEKQQQLTQMAVHKIFERPTMDPALCFAGAANSVILSAFYAWLIPIGLPLCMVSLFLQLWINKFKLLRTQSVPAPLGSELPAEMIDYYYELIVLIYSLGCLTFELLLYKHTRSYTIVMNGIALLFFILPINKYINSKLSDGSNYIQVISYQEARQAGHFTKDYDRINPPLMTDSIRKEIDFLIGNKKKLSKKQTVLFQNYPVILLKQLKQQQVERYLIKLKQQSKENSMQSLKNIDTRNQETIPIK